ncbi:hydantoinase B/oxoprolinase family protein [Nocardioides pocheonensis]|jgi:N-methylhydantoinase B|uniref:Hydantoinase B/oxoprolinase family protein n=1 Tax=Nocardioides pocheonensis TaxID=661485 RepID=A0A3N0GH74_9ACTN|nr:hydantoinase B/oxoprolinase family protein [Nocardioides pocheonensis]RNM11805.1 hydantoinase B/oxoprolinase family protein [Nocardioides pocheonensis]
MNDTTFDAVRTAVIANKVDGIVREMTNTLLRSARSAVINSARDFSCAILTADHELLAAAEGIPVHIFGAQLQAAAMSEAHPDLREGDAFLDNNPYIGNSHAADHTILVPVFVDGEHLFTAVSKAHQADIGNSIPTTYHAAAKDVYEEGALIFPTVKVQSDYQNVDDVIRMCRSRIRVPSQWYGDFLAAIGSARIAERRLKELVAKYGAATIKAFIRDWLDYSEKVMVNAIESLPAATLHNTGKHDAFEPYLPDGLEIGVTIEIKPDEGIIHVDLTENAPNVDCGLNMTEATTRAAVFGGIFNAIPMSIPKNSGAFRRVVIDMNDGSAVGKPQFPHSCSLATTNVTDRLINCVGAAFAQLGAPYGVAEGAVGVGVGYAVLSGVDARTGDAFVNQLVVTANGGPGSAHADGWVTYGVPCVSGLMYRDSVEIDEIKMPIVYKHLRLVTDTGGAGKYRGGPSFELAYTPKENPITVIYPCDGQVNPSKGVAGGADGRTAESWLETPDGSRTRLPNTATLVLKAGEVIHGFDASGGGYGSPLERDPALVLEDVLEGWETASHATETYGVAFIEASDGLAVDEIATASRRSAAMSDSA